MLNQPRRVGRLKHGKDVRFLDVFVRDYDVIVYECRNTWTIWLRGEKVGDLETRAAALELAGYLALRHSRPAWLLDETGYPLKPIEPRVR